MKDEEPNKHSSDRQRGLGGTSATRLTICEVAQHDAPVGAAAALCNVISSWRDQQQSSFIFPQNPNNFGR